MFYDICIFINKQVDIYSLAKLQLKQFFYEWTYINTEKSFGLFN